MNLPEIVKPELPVEWNYEESVQKVKTAIYKWKNLTEEVLRELWIAREKLSTHYHREDDGTKVPTWSDYCQDIGSSKRVVNRWLLALKEKREKLIKEKDDRTGVLQEGQSHNLGLLKDIWVKATAADKKRFLEWIKIRNELKIPKRRKHQ